MSPLTELVFAFLILYANAFSAGLRRCFRWGVPEEQLAADALPTAFSHCRSDDR
jgi:hypothetical protein